MTWIRIAISWRAVEPVEGERDWSAIDALVEEASRLGLEIMAYVAHTPDWAAAVHRSSPRGPKTLPPRGEEWDGFLRAAVERYRADVRFWQIWNEPSFGFVSDAQDLKCKNGAWCGTPEEYADLLRRSYEIVHELDPDAQVVLGGLVMTPRTERDDFLGRMLDRYPDHPLFDISSFHHYGTMAELEDKYTSLREKLRDHRRDRPIWLTETGVGNRGSPRAVPGYEGEDGQVRYLHDVVDTSARLGIARVAWFKLFDNEKANPRFASHGLFTLNGRGKRIVFALESAIGSCP